MKGGRNTLLTSKDLLIVPVRNDLDDAEACALRDNLLERAGRADIKGLVLDVSALDVIDFHSAEQIKQVVATISLMDVTSVIVGIRPAVAITLTDMGVRFDIPTAMNLEHGIELLRNLLND